MRCLSHFEMIRGKAFPWRCHSYKAVIEKREQKPTFTLFSRAPACLARILRYCVVSRMRRPCILSFRNNRCCFIRLKKTPPKRVPDNPRKPNTSLSLLCPVATLDSAFSFLKTNAWFSSLEPGSLLRHLRLVGRCLNILRQVRHGDFRPLGFYSLVE